MRRHKDRFRSQYSSAKVISNGCSLTVLFFWVIIISFESLYMSRVGVIRIDELRPPISVKLIGASKKISATKANMYNATYEDKFRSQYSSAKILSHGCSLTVIFFDPQLSKSSITDVRWSVLESVAINVPQDNTCFILQTSSCSTQRRKERTEVQVLKKIKKKARKNFRSMIHRGNVRVSFIDYNKYHFRNCYNFFPPSNAWMMGSYWDDEFTSYDSDLVLTIQHDTVLCHKLNPDLFREFAFVGAPWPRFGNDIKMGYCNYITEKWVRWNKNQTVPFDVCENGLGPVGNGGLSLRSRSWMRKAIQACPHKYNYLENNETELRCELLDWVPEDLYFATVLRGLNATLPSAFEASIFSAEMLLPENVLEIYGLPENQDAKLLIKKRWGNEGVEKYIGMLQRNITVPIGLHKPWLHINRDILLGNYFDRECPYLKDVIPRENAVDR